MLLQALKMSSLILVVLILPSNALAREANQCSIVKNTALHRMENAPGRPVRIIWDPLFVRVPDAECPATGSGEASSRINCSKDFGGGYICCGHTDHYSVCCLASPNGPGGCIESHF